MTIFGNNNELLINADTHNLASGDESWFDSLGTSVDNAGKFATAATVSGLSGLYNSGVAVSNFLGGDAEEIKIYDKLSEMDTDLGRYYQENQQAIDAVGFIGTSFIPGIGGIKAYQAGSKALLASKAGRWGLGTEQATGLLPAFQKKFLAQAIEEAGSSAQVFKVANANYWKSLAAGAGEQFAQAAAFEVGVAATMFNSPLLKDMSLGELTQNALTGAAFGGTLGTVFEGASSWWKLKKGVAAADQALDPFRRINVPQEGAPEFYKIREYAVQRLNAPEPILQKTGNLAQDERMYQSALRLHKEKLESLTNLVTESSIKLAGGDVMLGRRFAADILRAGSPEVLDNALVGLKKISRVATKVGDDSAMLSAAAIADAKASKVSIINAVDNTVESEFLPRLADTLEDGQKIKFADDCVKVGDKQYDMYQYRPGTAGKKSDNRIPLFKNVVDTANPRMEVEARYMWALNKKFEASDVAFSTGESRTILVGDGDLPMLERIEKFWDKYVTETTGLKVDLGNNVVKDFRVREELSDYITFMKMEGVHELSSSGLTVSEIAQRLNVSKGFVLNPMGVVGKIGSAGMDNTMRMELEKNTRAMQHAFFQGDNTLVLNEWAAPSHYMVEYDAKALSEFIEGGMHGDAYFGQMSGLLQQEADSIADLIEPRLTDLLPEFAQELLGSANKLGAGSGMFTSASGEYFSLASLTERIGQITAELGLKAKTDTLTTFQATKLAVAQDPKALMEFNVLDTTMRKFTEKFELYSIQPGPLDTAGAGPRQFLIPRAIREQLDASGNKEGIETLMRQHWMEHNATDTKRAWLTADNAGLDAYNINIRELPKDLPMFIPMSPKVARFVNEHIAQNDARLVKVQRLMAHKGVPIANHSGTYYPAPYNLDNTPYYAFVRDPKIGGSGHVGVIFGRTPQELEEQIARVDSREFQVIRKKQQEDLHKQALADYRWDMGIVERNVDSSLKRKGILYYNAPPLESTRLLDDVVAWHGDKAEQLVREGVATKYEQQIKTLEMMGRNLGAAETSVFGGITSKLIGKTAEQNPYLDYVKTMLNVSRKSEFPIQTASRWIEDRFDGVWNGVRANWKKIRSPHDDKAIQEFNDYMSHKGLGTPYKDAAMIALNDMTIDKGVLSKIVGKLNSTISGVTLGMDFFNGINNVIGSTVLMSSEIKYLQNLVKGDPELSKMLQAATKVKAPGTDAWMESPVKLMANAITDFFRDGKLVNGTMETKLMSAYRSKGFIGDELQRFRQMMYDASIQGSETYAQLNSKVEKVFEQARKFTGNTMAEDFTRFMAAHIGTTLTEPLVLAGKLSQKQADVIVHSMVNKVNGNYLASQRASITQGALGQATTLFLTYQMNLIQQMFKYVGSGDKKAAITAMLAQGSMYGMQGLPGFNYINAKVANMAGNEENVDLYDTVQGTVNDEAFKWVMYGLGSNALSVVHPGLASNMYNRGDLNPRNPFLIPTDFANIPAVSITARFFGNIANTAANIAKGGDVTNSLLLGLEHNAINRPLAGLAQAINGRVTTNSGGLIADTGDFVSVANFTRLVGGQPLAVSMSKDWLYRQQAYQAQDRAKLEELGTAFKTAVQDGKTVSQEDLEDFMGAYKNAGGNMENFGSWMSSQMMRADQSVFADIKEKLRSPFATYLQQELGGASLYSEPEEVPQMQSSEVPQMQ